MRQRGKDELYVHTFASCRPGNLCYLKCSFMIISIRIIRTLNHNSLHTHLPSLSLSRMITVDDEVPSDNDKQLSNNLIVILNVSLCSCIISSMMSTLNDDDVAPTEIVTLNTEAVTL